MYRHANIYVVDDDDCIRDFLRVLLEVEGYTVLDFASGVEFLRLARLDGRCCIVADVHMPDMSGLELLERVRADNTMVPIVIMTGRFDTAIERAVVEHGVILLEKPFRNGDLVGSIERALAGDGPS